MPNQLLTGTVQPAPHGLKGFDVNSILSSDQALSLKDAGYDFCLRYLGTQYGNFAASYAKNTVMLPPGINVWCDLEGVADDTSPEDVIAYCQAWYYAVHSAGYIPGVYVGYNTGLTPDQLYNNLSFQHYWQAYNGPLVSVRGFQLLQDEQITMNGITFDPDITQVDNEGDSALWLLLD